MKVTLNKEYKVMKCIEGKLISHKNDLGVALKKALRYSKEGGFIASLPQLLYARIHSGENEPYRCNECGERIGIWGSYYTNSEEFIGKTKKGNEVLVINHGGRMISPKQIKKGYDHDRKYVGISDRDEVYSFLTDSSNFQNLLSGKLPGGEEIPVFSFNEFNRENLEFPSSCAIVMDFNQAKRSKSGYYSQRYFQNDPLFIARAGGIEIARKYLEKTKKVYENKVGFRHSFNDKDIPLTPEQPQGHLLCLGASEYTDFGYYEKSELGYHDIFSSLYCFDKKQFIAVSKEDLEDSECVLGLKVVPENLW